MVMDARVIISKPATTCSDFFHVASPGILMECIFHKFCKDSSELRNATRNLQLIADAFGRICLTLFTCVMLYLIYNSVKSAGSKSGAGGLGGLLGEDASFEVMTPDLTFEDVAGNEHALQEMQELVGYLTNPAKYIEMGCEIPKGYLLCGPPGVGKTLMAKALAGEAGVPFYYSSGSGFEEIFVGVGAGRVRKMFEQAQANAPSIIFIDEIDSIGQKRKINDLGYSNRGTLNQMLSCMDGFENNNGVIVIAATNEPDTLDSALTREGRFDTKISIRVPPIKGRLEILKVHTRNKVLAEDVDLENIATACTQMTGAQLATLANTAALRTVLEGRDAITQDDFEFARARLLIGHINEDIEVSDTQMLDTAAHEAGHALLTVLREEITQRPVYITTILPRGRSLGHVQPVSKRDQHTENIASMIAQIDICIAGRVGEELHHNFVKGKVSTGCSSDMKMATSYAEFLVKKCGYSDRIGLIKANDGDKNDLTEKVVHEDTALISQDRYQIVKSDMMKHKKEWKALTYILYRYKTLTG
ncbi:ATP-dependent zinc metalloprotease YME1L1-like [Bolinopsis microptera]|uniref:ATP-dependent zinc metalloprotease YME1L1-like n=1 Tax=Bolinopsis microptera TaxID=2820187 RepID=UPI003079D017